MDETKKHKNSAKWEYESVDQEKAGLIKDALRRVTDPELGYSVIDLGLIRNVQLNDNRIMITMILTTPFCPYGPQLVEQVRIAAAEASGKKDTFVDLRFDPWDQDMMEDGFELDWGLY